MDHGPETKIACARVARASGRREPGDDLGRIGGEGDDVERNLFVENAHAAVGGLNPKVTNYFAVRVYEADDLMTRLYNGPRNGQNNFRIETGLVFRFRKR